MKPGMLLRRSALAIVCVLVAASTAAQSPNPALQDEAVRWLQSYIRVNTVNPPGNEIAGVQFFKAILDAEGIPYETAESAPGRGNIWARLKGGDQPALMLLHHMDVVPANQASWQTDPLSGEIKDGYVYGRGALDTKSSGILHLAAFVALHRAKTALNRDVIFMATADEEAGGFFGVGWLVKHRPELFKNVGFVLNEGGDGGDPGRADAVRHRGHAEGSVLAAPHRTRRAWSRIHSSSVLGVTTLIAALEKLRQHQFEPRIVPAVAAYFKGIAPGAPPAWRERYANIAAAIRTPGVLAELQRDDPSRHTLVRNTCSITRLGGSDKINVVPPEAWAEIDCRLLPDQDPKLFLARARPCTRRRHQDRNASWGSHRLSLRPTPSCTACWRPSAASTSPALRSCHRCSAASPTATSCATSASPPMASPPLSFRSKTRARSTATTSGYRSRTFAGRRR